MILQNMNTAWRKYIYPHLRGVLERRWFDVGLRAKMSSIVLAGLSGLIGVFALLGISTARQTTRQVLQDRMMLAQLGATSLDATLRHIRSDLQILAETQMLSDPSSTTQECSDTIRQLAFMTEGIFLLNQRGHTIGSVFCKTVPQETVQILRVYDWSSLPAIQAVLNGDPSTLSIIPLETHETPGGAHPWAILSVPVYDEHDNLIRVLGGLLDLSNPDLFAIQTPFGLQGSLDVVNTNGLVLISTHPERVLTTSDPEEILGKVFSANQPRVATCLGCDGSQPEGRDEVIAFAPLLEADWGVLVRQQATETFAPVRRLMLQTLIFGALAALGALGLVWITTNSVINPVQRLTEAAKRISAGDLDTPIDHAETQMRRDEIGVLANGFKQMRHKLKQSMDEIQAWNRELDSRVQEHTAEALAAQCEAQAARDDLRAIIDALSDRLVVVDINTSQVLQFNKAALNGGNDPDEMIGQHCCEQFHQGQCQSPECTCPRPEVLATGKSVKVTHIHKDPLTGADQYVDIVASPMYDTQGTITRIVELARDVTEERRIRESLERRNQQLAILNSLSTTVNQSLNLEEILNKALHEVLRLTGIDVGAIFIEEQSLGNLKLRAYQGLSEEAAQLAARLGLLDSACGGVMEKGSVIVVPDVKSYSGKRARSLRNENICTLVHVPLTTKGYTLGSMCIGAQDERKFSLEEQNLLTSIGHQIASAVENARLYAEVQHKEHIRGELFRKALNAQEEERRRIARELHDETSQSLTALLYATEESLEMETLDEIHERMGSMHELVQHTLDGVHKIIFDLRPTMLDHLGLVPALRWFAQSRLEPRGMRVTVEVADEPRRLTAEVETAIFRVVQEAITNIARHSAARNVCILFHLSSQEAKVTIEDDGIGFEFEDVNISPESGRGLGLLGMRERLELICGEMDVDTQPGYGTQIHIRVPLTEREFDYA